MENRCRHRRCERHRAACARFFAGAGHACSSQTGTLRWRSRWRRSLAAWRRLDIGDDAAVETAAAAIEPISAVSVLVNSAGVLQRTLPPDQLAIKEWDFVVRIDLRGTYLCCAAFGKRMPNAAGAIVNIASVAGMRSGPLHAYGPAKAGSSVLASASRQSGASRCGVNTVSPGFTQDAGARQGHLDRNARRRDDGQEHRAWTLGARGRNRRAVAYLASDLASGSPA